MFDFPVMQDARETNTNELSPFDLTPLDSDWYGFTAKETLTSSSDEDVRLKLTSLNEFRDLKEWPNWRLEDVSTENGMIVFPSADTEWRKGETAFIVWKRPPPGFLSQSNSNREIMLHFRLVPQSGATNPSCIYELPHERVFPYHGEESWKLEMDLLNINPQLQPTLSGLPEGCASLGRYSLHIIRRSIVKFDAGKFVDDELIAPFTINIQ